LLTPEVRAAVGHTSEPVPLTVTARVVARALETYGLPPREFAPGDPVPGYVAFALESDARSVEAPEVMPQSLLISNEVFFERPLRLGEHLTVQARLADISERLGGRFGYSVYVRTETELRDSEGNVVARTAVTMMQYDAADGEPGEEDE
jgi:hypothetical protein